MQIAIHRGDMGRLFSRAEGSLVICFAVPKERRSKVCKRERFFPESDEVAKAETMITNRILKSTLLRKSPSWLIFVIYARTATNSIPRWVVKLKEFN